jgi:AcrR family transcriptional regulator
MLLDSCSFSRALAKQKCITEQNRKKVRDLEMSETTRKMDRRTLRTQAALREGLVRLLTRKDYDEITIQEILDEANVGRSTFYSHCSGKDQLLRLSLRMLRAEIAATDHGTARGSRSTDWRPFAFGLPLLMHMAEHRHLYPSLAHGRGHDVFMNEIRQMVFELAKADAASFPKRARVPHDIAVRFVVGSFMTLLAWWLERKARLSPQALNEMFQLLACYGLCQEQG